MSNLNTKNPWLIRNLLYVIAILALIIVVFSNIFKELGLLQGLKDAVPPTKTLLLAILLQWVAMLVSIYIVFIRKVKSPRQLLGFTKNNKWLDIIKKSIFAYFIYFSINFLIVVILINLGVELPGYQAQEPHLPIFGVTPLGTLLAVLVMVILAPIVEEIFFRGYILNLLAHRLGNLGGNLVTAIIFAGFHLEPQSFLGLFVLGIVINELFLRTKSLYASILFHMINNAIAMIVEYNF